MGLPLTDELPLPRSIRQFCEFLSIFEGGLAPLTLLHRGCTDRPTWSRTGEILKRSPNEALVPEWLIPLFNQEAGLPNEVQHAVERGALQLEKRRAIQHISLCNGWEDIVHFQKSGSAVIHTFFDALAVIMHAFPEPYAHIAWEETQYQLWAVVESTCFSFLSILGEPDILEYLDTKSSDARGPYLTRLLSFLLRISSILSTKSPIWVIPLTSLVLRLVKAEPFVSHFDVQYLELLVHLNDIVYRSNSSDKETAIGIRQLKKIEYRLDERSNAAVGFAIIALPPRAKSTLLSDDLDSEGWSWTPISVETPSPLEAIAWMKLLRYNPTSGASSLLNIENFNIETQALIAFDIVRGGMPQEARTILERSFSAIREYHGAASPEYVITVTELVNCCNLVSAEDTGESYAQDCLSRVPKFFLFEDFGHHNLILSYVDSLIGLKRYTEAEAPILGILQEPSKPWDIATKAALRLLKVCRRQGRAWHKNHTKLSLEVVLDNFVIGSDALKAECIEEILCYMSLVDRKNQAQLHLAHAVVVELQSQLEGIVGQWSENDTLLSWHTEALARYGEVFKKRLLTIEARNSRRRPANLATQPISNSPMLSPTVATPFMDIYRITSRTLQTIMSFPILESGKAAWRNGIGLIDLIWVTSKWQELAVALLLDAHLEFLGGAAKRAVISEKGKIVLVRSDGEASTPLPGSISDRRSSLGTSIEAGSPSTEFKKSLSRPKRHGTNDRALNREFALSPKRKSRRREKVTDQVSSDQSCVLASMGFRTLFFKARIILRHYKGF